MTISAATTHQDEITVGANNVTDATRRINLRKDTLHEITQLSRTVLQIEWNLGIIAGFIQDFDSVGALKDTDDLPLQFFSQWSLHRETYNSLLNNSRSAARRLKDKTDDSLKTLTPLINDASASFDNKQRLVSGFIKGLDEFETQGTDMAQDFYNLRESVRNFERNLSKQIGAQDDGAQQRISEILVDIKRLEAEIEALSGFFSACRSVLNTRTVLRSANLIASAPVLSTLLLVSGVGAVGAVGYVISQRLDQRAKDIQERKDCILDLQLEKELLNSRRDELREIDSKMSQLTLTFDEVVSGIGSMQRMWKMISLDAIGLQETMGQLRKARTSAGFDRRIQDVEKMWRALACTLDGYACGIGPSWATILKRYWPLIVAALWDLWNFYYRSY